MPDTIQDPTGSLGRTIDNGKAGAASPVRAIEHSLQYLAAGRKVFGGSGCFPWSMTQAQTFVVELRVRREAYTEFANVIILSYDSGVQSGPRFTVGVSSTTDAAGFTADITPAQIETGAFDELAYASHQIAIGTGVNTEFGTEDLTLTFTGPGGAVRTLYVVYIGVQPLPMESITV